MIENSFTELGLPLEARFKKGWWQALAGMMSQNSLSGKFIDYTMNKWATNEQNYQAKVATDEQRAWEDLMSSTAHQREVKDLVNAGLNPVLSAGGGGASSPSSQAAPVERMQPPIMQPDLMNVVQAHQIEQKIKIDRDLADEAIAKSKADRGYTGVKTVKEQKGLPRAEIEGAVWRLLKQMGGRATEIQKRMYKPPSHVPNQPSSMGELP